MRKEWKHHKYIRKEGNRYIYPEDLARMKENVNKTANNIKNYAVNTANKVSNNTIDRLRKTDDSWNGTVGVSMQKGFKVNVDKDPNAYEENGYMNSVGANIERTKAKFDGDNKVTDEFRAHVFSTLPIYDEDEYGEKDYGPLRISKAEDGIDVSLDLQYGKTIVNKVKDETKKKGRKLAYKILKMTE